MPITPHICEELFKNLGLAYDNTCVTWPKANKDFIKDDNMLIIIQINGKVRKKIDVKSNTSKGTTILSAILSPANIIINPLIVRIVLYT